MCEVINYYYNGNIKETYLVIDNKREGEYKEYYGNGIRSNQQLWIICNYINDKIEGEYKQYWKNGQLCEQGVYIYQAEITSLSGVKFNKRGHVTLLSRVK